MDQKNDVKKCSFDGLCPVDVTMEVIGGKWKLKILYHLKSGVKRFGELKRQISGITQKMLTQQLRELESDKVIERKVYAEVPPKVEYTLTKLGQSLSPVVHEMAKWGKEKTKQIEKIRSEN
ncbi:MAG: helix-turn-helix domain-containing protein [Chloroherpetonaceae bacterium]|nr:helix-turn-helix domain-containing protein [Chloroherpetonaceae bacterium]